MKINVQRINMNSPYHIENKSSLQLEWIKVYHWFC